MAWGELGPLRSDFVPSGTDFGWRTRPLAGALRLRPPISLAGPGERDLVRRHASGARTAVEIGVAEGGSAAAIRESLDPEGTLYLIDPYPAGRLGVNFQSVIAHRALPGSGRGKVVWLKKTSEEAGTGWSRPIDFLFVDADNSFEGAVGDWERWSPHIRPAGIVVLQGARTAADTWVPEEHGPARLLRERISRDPAWKAIEGVGAAVALRRLA
jgi:predicted O-methyltransferase YrrM